jgi:hypothetical protein
MSVHKSGEQVGATKNAHETGPCAPATGSVCESVSESAPKTTAGWALRRHDHGRLEVE